MNSAPPTHTNSTTFSISHQLRGHLVVAGAIGVTSKIKMVQKQKGARKSTNGKTNEAQAISTRESIVCSVCLDHLKEPMLLPCMSSLVLQGLPGRSPSHPAVQGYTDRAYRREMYRKGRKKNKMEKYWKDRKNPCERGNLSSMSFYPYSVPKDGFPSDLVATNALAFHQDFQKPRMESANPIVCNACTEGDLATAHCPACNRFLCEFCSKAHKRLVDFRTHTLVPLDKADAEALKAFERLRHCSQHQGEVLKLYCKTCHCLICRDYTIVEHRDHAFGFTATLRPEVQQEIQEMATAMAAKQREFQAHLEFMKAAEKGRGEHSGELQKEINAAFDSVVKAVEQQRQILLQQEESGKTADLKEIWAQKEFIEMTLANIASGVRYVDRLCNCTNDQDMLAMSHEVKQQLSAMQGRSWDPEAGFLSSNLLTFALGTNGQQLSKSIDELRSLQSPELTVSMCPIGLRGSSQYNLQLRSVLRFTVEVKCTSHCKLNTVVLPSVSVQDATTQQDVNYAHTLLFEQKNNSWTLTVVPTYPGVFTVSVSMDVKTKDGGSQHVAIHDPACYEGWSEGSDDEYYPATRTRHTNPTFTLRVTGVPKPGDKVCRGPGWRGGNEDGGVGSEGIVTVQTNVLFSAGIL